MKYTAEQLQHFTTIIRTLPEERRQEAREMVKALDDFARADDALADFVLSVNTEGATEIKRKASDTANKSAGSPNKPRKAPRASKAVKSTNKTIKDGNKADRTTQTANIDRLERVEGETITNNPQLDIEEIETRINNCIMDFCQSAEIDGIEGLRKAEQPIWQACCMYIGKHIFKGTKILKDTTLHDVGSAMPTSNNRYDPAKIAQVLTIYDYLCNIYGKVFTQWGAAAFCGVDNQYFNDHAEELTRESFQVLEKREASLADAIASGRRNPTGALAQLNHFHSWTTSTAQRVERTETTVIYPVLVDINKNDSKLAIDGKTETP